jgi:hypothetical protein
MISRRQIFGFIGLLLIPSRWRIFAQSKPAQSTQPELMIMKSENNVRTYFAEGRMRIEIDKKKVVINRFDLMKTWTLDLKDRTYSEQLIQLQPPFGTARLITDVTPNARWETLKTDDTTFPPYDASLFEIPANFKKA